MTVRPQRAIVAPRAVSRDFGQSLLLTDLILLMIDSKDRMVRLTGHGKTTALSHLAAELDPTDVVIVDDADPADLNPLNQFKDARLIVLASEFDIPVDQVVEISPWGQDEVIEYVVGKFPEKCQSVMSRITDAPDAWLANGTPAIWTPVLTTMANTESVRNIREALSLFLAESLKDPEIADLAKEVCTKYFRRPHKAATEFRALVPEADKRLVQAIAQKNVCFFIASEEFTTRIRDDRCLSFLNQRLPDELLELIGQRIKGDSAAMQTLARIACQRFNRKTATAASLLTIADRTWRPKSSRCLSLNDARLPQVDWQRIRLLRCECIRTDFSKALFQNAKFGRTKFWSTNFSDADLQESVFFKVDATETNFSIANLSKARFRKFNGVLCEFGGANMQGLDSPHSNLVDCNFWRANLADCNLSEGMFQGSDFTDANLTDSDFTNANMSSTQLNNTNATNANFRGATMSGVNLASANLAGATFAQTKLRLASLESQILIGNSFQEADLSEAFLTHSRMRNVDLSNANLQSARLAEIDWVDCALRNVDFSGSQFHLGSTRCGMVDSVYPSHGTRTGFYTDDYDDQYFKYPEEIRKANLSYCDLTGAKVWYADFYLVDLRGAKYTEDQEEHFRKCKAILN